MPYGSLHCHTLACQNGSLHCHTLACQNGSLHCHTLACQNGSLHCHIRSPTVRRPPRAAWSKVSSADIDHYSHLVSCSITTLPSQIYSCVTPNCTEHNHSLDSYARNFLSTLLDCARQCFPQHSSSPRRLVCWNDILLVVSLNRLRIFGIDCGKMLVIPLLGFCFR